jgi:hypothetical protein
VSESDQVTVALHVMFGPRLCYAYVEGQFHPLSFTDANGRLYQDEDVLFQAVSDVLGKQKTDQLRETRTLRNETITRAQLDTLCGPLPQAATQH